MLFVFGGALLAGYGVKILSRIARKYTVRMYSLIAFVTLLELIPYAKQFIVIDRTIPQLRHDKRILDIVRSGNPPDRTFINMPKFFTETAYLDLNAPYEYRFFGLNGFDLVIPRNLYEFFYADNGHPMGLYDDESILSYSLSMTSLNFLNVRYLLVPAYNDPVLERLTD